MEKYGMERRSISEAMRNSDAYKPNKEELEANQDYPRR